MHLELDRNASVYAAVRVRRRLHACPYLRTKLIKRFKNLVRVCDRERNAEQRRLWIESRRVSGDRHDYSLV